MEALLRSDFRKRAELGRKKIGAVGPHGVIKGIQSGQDRGQRGLTHGAGGESVGKAHGLIAKVAQALQAGLARFLGVTIERIKTQTVHGDQQNRGPVLPREFAGRQA